MWLICALRDVSPPNPNGAAVAAGAATSAAVPSANDIDMAEPESNGS